MYNRFIFSWLALLFSSEVILAQGQTPEQDSPFPDSTSLGLTGVGVVNLPFGKGTQHDLTTGSVWVIHPGELMSYDNIQDVGEAIQGRVPGMRGLNIREFEEVLTIVDGVPRPLTSLSLQEIEQITVLKDVNAAILYGVQASNGVILIKTKRGHFTKPRISAWVEYGISKHISYPKFLGAAEYMELYNEARINDGLSERYTLEDIQSTKEGSNPLRFPDTDYFSSTLLNNSRPLSTATADFTGGNENAQYYVNAGFQHAGSLLKLGEGSNEQTNRMNLRSNVNFRINDFIKSHLDIVAIYDHDKSARGDFWQNAANLRPNLFPLLIDTAVVSFPGAALLNGRYLLGGTSQYRDNVYGDLYFGGYNNTLNTTAQFTNGLDVDLRTIAPGLTFKALGSFDFYKRFREYQSNEYAVYELSWNNDNPDITKIGTEQFTGTQSLDNTLIRRVFGFNGSLIIPAGLRKKMLCRYP